MKKILNYNIWTPPPISTSIWKDIKKYNPTKVNIFAAEEYEITNEWTTENYLKFRNLFVEKNISVDFIFGSADKSFYHGIYNFPGDNINVHLWPFFFLFFTFCTLDKTKSQISRTQSYKNSFISMNGNPHEHRCLLLDLMAKNNLINAGHISWNSLNFTCEYPWKWWENPRSKYLTDRFRNTGHQYDLPLEWHESLINLVSETATKTVFFTEKTWIPILSKKPFIVQAKSGFYKIFQDLGFVLYDEIFDYAFDQETDLERRTQMILDNVKSLTDANYAQLYKKILPKIEHNFNQAITIMKDRNKIPDLITETKFGKRKYGALIANVKQEIKKQKL